MAPQIRLPAVEQEEKNSAGRSYCARIPSLAEVRAILAEAHAPDEHPAHQGHTPVLYRLLDASLPAAPWTVEGQAVLPLAWHDPSRTYARHPPASTLQAAYFQQSISLSEGRRLRSPSNSPCIVHQGPMQFVRLPLRCKQLTSHSPLDCRRAGRPTAKPGGCLSIHTPYSPPLFLRALLGRLSWERQKFWVLGRGPHAEIEMRKENPRQNDTGRDGEVLVQHRTTGCKHEDEGARVELTRVTASRQRAAREACWYSWMQGATRTNEEKARCRAQTLETQRARARSSQNMALTGLDALLERQTPCRNGGSAMGTSATGTSAATREWCGAHVPEKALIPELEVNTGYAPGMRTVHRGCGDVTTQTLALPASSVLTQAGVHELGRTACGSELVGRWTCAMAYPKSSAV
ncbi:hypothetical protein B0H14DRAFT_3133898 [Mycena olivaceomarginata]|nr:hypothetical protein B0H14DRAFT_3133898 [Mycena olivaceomarginata]